MPYLYNEATHKITIPRGDTATLHFTVDGGGVRDGDAVLFRVRNRSRNLWTITKIALVENGAATIRLTSADTRGLSSGQKYGWSIGVVSDPDTDVDGNPIANDATDNVLTAFNELMTFEVVESGVLGVDA